MYFVPFSVLNSHLTLYDTGTLLATQDPLTGKLAHAAFTHCISLNPAVHNPDIAP